MTKDEAKKIFREGYLAMDINRRWHWFCAKPFGDEGYWFPNGQCKEEDSYAPLKNIAPVDDWKSSLTRCGR